MEKYLPPKKYTYSKFAGMKFGSEGINTGGKNEDKVAPGELNQLKSKLSTRSLIFLF
jgi:hypothetical protein